MECLFPIAYLKLVVWVIIVVIHGGYLEGQFLSTHIWCHLWEYSTKQKAQKLICF